MENEFSYKNAGVDIERTDKLKTEMRDILDTDNTRVMNKVGAFASLYDFRKFEDIEEPVLVLKAEEPGSKQKLAMEHHFVRSICFDMINHLVNDIAVMGARPLAVLDTIVAGGIDEVVTKELVQGIADACHDNECELVGGETSIQPGILPSDTFVLTSSITGVVDKMHIVDGSSVKEGDVVLAVASNGLHTNGYTLVRKLMEKIPTLPSEKINEKTFLENIMIPHLAYYPFIKQIRNRVHAMAHITGGGIEGNLCRVIPKDKDARINLALIKPLDIFKTIKTRGNIDEQEMLSTFNCGVGLVLIADEKEVAEILSSSKKLQYNTYEIGKITSGNHEVLFENHVNW